MSSANAYSVTFSHPSGVVTHTVTETTETGPEGHKIYENATIGVLVEIGSTDDAHVLTSPDENRWEVLTLAAT